MRHLCSFQKKSIFVQANRHTDNSGNNDDNSSDDDDNGYDHGNNGVDYDDDYTMMIFIGDEDNSRSMKQCFELNLRINARANLKP